MKKWNRMMSAVLATLMLCPALSVNASAEELAPEVIDEAILTDGGTALEDVEIIPADDVLELDELGELDIDLALNESLDVEEPQAEEAAATPNSYTDGNYDHDAFDIDNSGWLQKYNGSDKTVAIPDGVIGIASGAICNNSTVNYVTIPASVESIQPSAIYACDSLKGIVVSDDNPYYRSESGVLYNSGMDELVCFPGAAKGYTIPTGVTSIGDYAFYCCDNLANINISSSVTRIGDHAFEYCTGLTNVKVPDGVTYIGKLAFSDCDSLKRIDIPYSVKTIEEGVFWGCDSLTSMNMWGDVNIPSSVTSIGGLAFYKCPKIGTVTIPRSVKNIGEQAFEYCSSLVYTSIPSSVKHIGSDAFYGCSSLTNLTVLGKNISIDDADGTTFRGGSGDLVIYAWENSNVYKWFKNHNYPVKALPDYFLLLSGNKTQKAQLGDKIWIVLDGPKAKSYTSSNKKVATVSSKGEVTLKKTGKVKITATTTTGGKWVLTLNVIAAPKLNRSSVSLKVGKRFSLKVNGLLSGRKVTWTSSNSAVATVTNGKITAKKAGKCVIYAQVKNGVKLKCTVKVTR